TPQFGDFSGHGRLDLFSGSNCCDPYRIHLFLRRENGSFAERAEVRFKEPQPSKFARGKSRPYLVDWDRDGHTDLVIGCLGSWTFEVGLGPLADKKNIAFQSTNPANLPPIEGASPIHFLFADWDRDGRMDLLVGVDRGVAVDRPPRRYSVYWYRNT